MGRDAGCLGQRQAPEERNVSLGSLYLENLIFKAKGFQLLGDASD